MGQIFLRSQSLAVLPHRLNLDLCKDLYPSSKIINNKKGKRGEGVRERVGCTISTKVLSECSIIRILQCSAASLSRILHGCGVF